MAKQYEEYKKTFEQIQKKIKAIAEDIKKNANFVAQTSGIIKEGAKEVGNRIQELKDQGQTGSTIKAFEADPEVKKMLASIDSYMSGLEKELKRIKGVHEGESTKTRALFWATKKELTAEIAKRKKEVSTKLGTGNKSLPDMEKLLKEMDKYPDEMPYAGVDVFTPEDIAQHRKELDRDLADEIKKAKDVKLTAEQKMLDEQALNIRNLTHNVARAKLLCDALLKTCQSAEAALKERNQKALMVAKAELPKPLKELGELASIGERALKDSWIKKGIETSKDKSKILAGIKAIAQFKTTASEAVKKVANARL
jgi:hypothetical protein